MNIAVCINQVPDTASRVEVRDGAIEGGYLNMVLNPYDEYAVEEALRVRERQENTVVTVFSAGEKGRYDVLRKALAMGADHACLVEGGSSNDSRSVAASLSKAIRSCYEGLPDLVFCGRESADCNRAQVPVMLAEMLGMAVLTAVSKLSMENGAFRAWREIEGGMEEYLLFKPSVISVEKGLNVPRKTNIKAVMKARKQSIVHLDGSVDNQQGVQYLDLFPVSRERKCRFAQTAEELARLLHEEGRVVGQ